MKHKILTNSLKCKVLYKKDMTTIFDRLNPYAETIYFSIIIQNEG